MIRAPQITAMVLCAMDMGFALAKHHLPHPDYDAGASMVADSLVLALVFWAGWRSEK